MSPNLGERRNNEQKEPYRKALCSRKGGGVMETKKLYGQAEYYYAVSREILAILLNKSIITEEQQQRIDDLNRKTIFETYPSVEDLEQVLDDT